MSYILSSHLFLSGSDFNSFAPEKQQKEGMWEVGQEGKPFPGHLENQSQL